MGIYKSMSGLITLELTSAAVGASLNRINGMGITIFDVRSCSELTVQFTVYRRDYRSLMRMAEKYGESIRILGRKGLYWRARQLRQRPILIFGIALMLFLALFVPSRVYFVQVEGNLEIPTRQILEAAEQSGIRFGASRREVRSEKMKNELLGALPGLQWAGVNTYGCTAVISVRERSDSQTETEKAGVSSIVAARDGVILSCTVTKGNSLCTVGQAVQEGQVLISGYTDCGICITATRAEGEILAQTNRELTIISPGQQLKRVFNRAETVKYSLIIGKKRINFFKGSGISDGSCVKMYSEYVLTLPGGFELPVVLVKETLRTYEQVVADISEDEARENLSAFSSDYLKKHTVAGNILYQTETLEFREGAYSLTGQYACTEMIGRQRSEEIGEQHGKTD